MLRACGELGESHARAKAPDSLEEANGTAEAVPLQGAG